MNWEMAMEIVLSDAPYVAAILGATLGLVTFFLYQSREAQKKIHFYEYLTTETESALISADRVLKNGATPRVVRQQLLCMLETLASPEIGRDFTEYFIAQRAGKRKGKPGSSNELSEAMDKLHVENPKLAADAHTALMGIILAIPVMHADKVEVLEYVDEGARNPGLVFEKASRALSHVDRHKDGRSGVGGGLAVV